MKGIQYGIALLAFSAVALIGCNSDTDSKVDQTKAQVSQAANKMGGAVSEGSKKVAVEAGNDATSGKVKAALLAAADLDASKIQVDSDDKRVTLSGTVPTADEKARAGKVAKDLLGSDFGVNNLLVVDPKKA